jgi:hypothetical protein
MSEYPKPHVALRRRPYYHVQAETKSGSYLAKPVKTDILKRKLDAYIAPRKTTGPGSSNSSPGPHPSNDLNGSATALPMRVMNSKSSSSNLPEPARTSSDTRFSDAGSSVEALPTTTKRQPRKLTKSRGNSEAGLEKTKSFLQKKNPRGSMADETAADASAASSRAVDSLAPSGSKKPEDGKRSQSWASMRSSGSKGT